ncbi:MAG: MFS transporter [Limnochordales bacterium]|nr:MFS transporter [Limnochordales bacterium]
MRWSIWDGVFASISDNLVIPFQALFALYLGASTSQVGLLTALPLLVGNILQLPFASLTERWGNRKKIYLYANFIARFLWLPAGAIPFFFQGRTAVNLFIGLVTLRSIFASAAVPGWTSLMADITPRRRRGRFFAWRNVVVNVAALAASVAAGWFIQRLPVARGYQLAFLLSFLAGGAALLAFARVPEPPLCRYQTGPAVVDQDADKSARGIITNRRAKPRVVSFLREFSWDALNGFLWTSALWNFAVNLAGPLMPVYYWDTLKGSEQIWGIGQGATFVVTILSQRYWGRLADQWGARRTLLLAGIGAALVPVPWIIARAPFDIVWAQLWSGLAWAGYNLASFNLLLEVTPEDHRTRSVGAYNLLMGIASALGPVIGAALAERWGLITVFIISTVLRFLGLLTIGMRVKIDIDRPWQWRDLLPCLPELRTRQGNALRWSFFSGGRGYLSRFGAGHEDE